MRIWPGSEHCHRHFTDFMLFKKKINSTHHHLQGTRQGDFSGSGQDTPLTKPSDPGECSGGHRNSKTIINRGGGEGRGRLEESHCRQFQLHIPSVGHCILFHPHRRPWTEGHSSCSVCTFLSFAPHHLALQAFGACCALAHSLKKKKSQGHWTTLFPFHP